MTNPNPFIVAKLRKKTSIKLYAFESCVKLNKYFLTVDEQAIQVENNLTTEKQAVRYINENT